MNNNYVPRSVFDVLKQVIKVIPNTEVNLISALKNYKDKELNYMAPELLIGGEAWEPFIYILNNFIPDKNEKWQIEIKDILENKN
jgi:hypothetical protein